MIDHAFGAARLERAIDRHGGAELWRRVAAVELEVARLSGPLLVAKGLGRSFSPPGRVRVEPRRGRVLWMEWPSPGMCGVYARGQVAIVAADAMDRAGEALRPRRQSFRGLRKWRRWRELDALYFFGYALAHYLALPFSLRGAQLISARRVAEDGCELWYRFPKGAHTHGRTEGFRFDASGLLLRHGYRAEVISRTACGAHRSTDYETLCGLPIASRRVVLAKPWHGRSAPVTSLEVLRATLRPVCVELVG